MQGAVKHLGKKVTLELICDVIDERTKKLKEKLKQFKQETKEDFKTINRCIDQIHIRLDQIMQMLVKISRK